MARKISLPNSWIFIIKYTSVSTIKYFSLNEVKVSIAKSVMGEEQFKLFSTIRRAETESGIIARMPFDIKGL